ncbi:MAG: hypothetical protein HYT50_00295 [Candidatus Wildermuthbacteria bacterium]|nr:hypothetical protein [Candidatus Wildermuthbacteria bacterium]
MKNVAFPALSQWRKLPQVFSKRERIAVLFLLFSFLGTGAYLAESFYRSRTSIVPARGGAIQEGIVGSARFLNPVFSDANDADRDIVQLVFSGITTFNAQGDIVPDLAQSIDIQEGGKVYEVTLKDTASWSDGLPVTTDDIIFTVQTIQDPKYKSPIRANWIGVDMEKISDHTLLFKLSQPYAPFLERLTLKPIPQHIWKDISPENFSLSNYNLEPVGSGPYKVAQVIRSKAGPVQEIKLEPNQKYHGSRPYITSFSIRFFDNEQTLLSASHRGEINSFALSKGEKPFGSQVVEFSLPRYFALFFNLESKNAQDPVKKKEVRQALEAATDKAMLAQQLFGKNGKTVSSPLLPSVFNLQEPEEKDRSPEKIASLLATQGYSLADGRFVKFPEPANGITQDLQLGSSGSLVEKLQGCLAKTPDIYPEGKVTGTFGQLTRQAVIAFQEKHAEEILKPQGLTAGTGKVGGGTREKINQVCFAESQDALPLTITVHTINQSRLQDAALMIKEQWEKAGIQVTIQAQAPGVLERETIKPRNFQVLLFGEILGKIADPFPFWHSSQKKDPGLNLTGYEKKELDTALEQARKESDESARQALYQKMQDILVSDVPAITLYDMEYVYVVPSDVKGIQSGLITDPSWRFRDVSSWYIKTKRSW